MAPKKKAEEPKDEPPKEESEDEADAAENEVTTRCFRVGGQVYYGECKAGSKELKGTFIRHGFGRQLFLGASPAGKVGAEAAWETVVVGIYEGQWNEDHISGQGAYKWSDGSSYDGVFRDGRPHGHGRFAWPDGTAYEGAWLNGEMTGQGRLASRFDGRFLQGRYYRNCYHSQSGRWENIVQKLRREEISRILEGDATGVSVRRCPFGEVFSGGSQDAIAEQKQALHQILTQIQAGGHVPFVVADTSLQGSALKALQATGYLDVKEQAVSVRLASIARRRRGDFHKLFFNALQSSLLTGNFFTIAFEDDDEGCELIGQEQPDWYARSPGTGVPTKDLPSDWQLSGFFEPAAFPLEVFQPCFLNGRNLARFFIPDQAQNFASSDVAGSALPATVPATAGSAVPMDAEAAGEQAPDPSSPPAWSEAARKLAALAGEQVPSHSFVGLTNWVWKADDDITPQQAGLPFTPALRPVVLAQGRLADGLSEDDVRAAIIARFGKHVPLHRAGIVLLTASEQVEPLS